MTVGVGHRSLDAAASEEDFATVLKEADEAFLANQNFHDVEAGMTRTPDLPEPARRRPPQSPLFPSIDGPIPFPAVLRRPGLHLDEDEHLAFEDNKVEFVAPMAPIDGETATALSPVIRLGGTLAHRPQIGGRRAAAPPSPQGSPCFGEKHA
jgi:hypothetical protein